MRRGTDGVRHRQIAPWRESYRMSRSAALRGLRQDPCWLAGRTSAGERGDDRVRENRPCRECPRPVVAVGQTGQRHVKVGVHPQEGAGPAEMPERRRGVPAPRPVRDLGASARSRAPSRADRTARRRAAHRAARGTPSSSRDRASRGVTSVGRRSSRASAARSRSGPWRPSDGRPTSSVSSIPSGTRTRPLKRDRRSRRHVREQGAQRVEARVRVDPARAGTREHGLAFEREAGGVGEQMADRGVGRPGRLVEVDHAVLDGIEHCQGGDELRHRRPSKRTIDIAVAGDDAGRTDDGRRGMVRTPGIDRGEGGVDVVHGG